MAKEPRKVREGKIIGDYFLVPRASHCWKLNPAEAELLRPIFEKYGRNTKPLDKVKENFVCAKIKINMDVTVPCYLEIEKALQDFRELPENKLTNVVKTHKYLTHGLKKQVEEICNNVGLTLDAIRLVEEKEIVYAVDTEEIGVTVAVELNEFVKMYGGV